MDMGDLTSRQIGNIMASGMLRAEEALMQGNGTGASQNQLAAMGRAAAAGISDADKGTVPSTIRNQNLGHNSKKAGLGPNTKR